MEAVNVNAVETSAPSTPAPGAPAPPEPRPPHPRADARALPLVLARRYGRWVAFAALALLLWGICAAPTPAGLTPEAQRALAVFAVCVVLWATQLLPLMVTGLLAMGLLALLGAADMREAFEGLSSPSVLFILGAFILAGATVQSHLSARVSLAFLKAVGNSPYHLAFGLLVGSAALSCLMPEHAVAAMLFPITLQIATALQLRRRRSVYGRMLFLAPAWGAVIGGVGTFLGGARTPLAIAMLGDYTLHTRGKALSIGFLEWAVTILPLVAVLLVVAAVVLRIAFPADVESVEPARDALREQLRARGPWTWREAGVGIVVLATVAAWIGLGDRLGLAPIAVLGVVALFVFRLADWDGVKESVNWGVVLMYGGAISLGKVVSSTGGAEWLARHVLEAHALPAFALVALLALLAFLLTEGMSNAAVVALLLPLALTLGDAEGLPLELVTIAVAVPAGLAFCMPMSTPANAIAQASGYVRMRDVLLPGLVLNVASWLLFLAAAWWWFPVLGLQVAP